MVDNLETIVGFSWGNKKDEFKPDRREFLKKGVKVVGAAATFNPLINALAGGGHPLGEEVHKLYQILYDNANSKELKTAIHYLSIATRIRDEPSQRAAFILFPKYHPSNDITLKVGGGLGGDKKVNPMGGDNPSYWAASRLAAVNVQIPTYTATIRRHRKEDHSPLPKEEIIMKFADSLCESKTPDDVMKVIENYVKVPTFSRYFKYNIN